jgi:hypothetical protein
VTSVVFLITKWSIFRQEQVIKRPITLFLGQFLAQKDNFVRGLHTKKTENRRENTSDLTRVHKRSWEGRQNSANILSAKRLKMRQSTGIRSEDCQGETGEQAGQAL